MPSPSLGDPEMADRSSSSDSSASVAAVDQTLTPESDAGPPPSDDNLALFLQLAKQRRARLLWLAMRFVNSRDDAEDILQEALMKAFTHLSQFRGESQMSTWLGVIVLNAGREWLRKRKRHAVQPVECFFENDEDSPVYDVPDLGRDPEKTCEYNELERILLSEIDELNPVCKSAIKMCLFEGRTHLEAANTLGVNAITIKSRIFHAKRTLKRAVCLRAGLHNNQVASTEASI
jgi:RNA polymerase sigma-70 factor, ECF subfamily